jgi:catechol 2,3-dioxygenase-like lactoylglutathione lyase family enzyme
MTSESNGRTVLKHLALRASDPEATRRFYVDGLGLRFLGFRPSGSGAYDLTDGHANLTVIPYSGAERPALPEVTEYIHFGFIVPDAAAVYERLRALGATMLRLDVKERLDPAAPAPDGSFKVADPDGNVVDITGNLREWRI